jgi:hypothetical protein
MVHPPGIDNVFTPHQMERNIRANAVCTVLHHAG